MPAIKKPIPPCPKCGKERLRVNGHFICRHCRREAAKSRYAAKLKPCLKCGGTRTPISGGGYRCRECYNASRQWTRPPLVEVECECGELFRRAHDSAVSRCRVCQQEANGTVWNPTPEEIRAGCAEIRAGWDDHQRRHRLGEQREEYSIPQLDSAWLLPGGMEDRDVFNF